QSTAAPTQRKNVLEVKAEMRRHMAWVRMFASGWFKGGASVGDHEINRAGKPVRSTSDVLAGRSPWGASPRTKPRSRQGKSKRRLQRGAISGKSSVDHSPILCFSCFVALGTRFAAPGIFHGGPPTQSQICTTPRRLARQKPRAQDRAIFGTAKVRDRSIARNRRAQRYS